MNSKRHLGFIGLGNMGVPMVQRLLAAGHQVSIWNRSSAKVDALVQLGALAASTPADVLRRAELLGICLKDGAAVEAVAFGPGGLSEAGADAAGKVIADFSTIDPDQTRSIAQRMQAECGASWIDAPVSGGVPGAEKGTLICFAGGDIQQIARLDDLLAPLMSRVTHMGSSGAGQTTKICNQMIVAVNVLTIAETYGLARRAGVSVENLAQALAGGFADSQPLQIFGPAMAARRFEPTRTAVELMAKDLGIAQQMAQRLNADTPVSEFCVRAYQGIRQENGDVYTGDVSRLVSLYE